MYATPAVDLHIVQIQWTPNVNTDLNLEYCDLWMQQTASNYCSHVGWNQK